MPAGVVDHWHNYATKGLRFESHPRYVLPIKLLLLSQNIRKRQTTLLQYMPIVGFEPETSGSKCWLSGPLG